MDQSIVEGGVLKYHLGISGSTNGVRELVTSILEFNAPTNNIKFINYSLECYYFIVYPPFTTCPIFKKCNIKALLLLN